MKKVLLYSDKKLQKKLGKNGKDAVLKGLNWETESDNLVKLYDKIY